MRSDPSSSDGFGGGVPAVSTVSFGVLTGTNRAGQRRLSGQDLRQPDAVLDIQRAVHAGPAHVSVDEEHTGTANGQRQRQVARRRRLALEGLRTRHHDETCRLRTRC